MDIKQMIGARIGELRSQKGMTQEQLSEKMGTSSKYLSSIERGKENPTLDVFIKLSKALKIDIGEIFRIVEAEDPMKRKTMILSLVNSGTEEQQKLTLKILSSIFQ